MPGTNFSDVFDQFLSFIEDYRLTALYQSSVTNFEIYLQGWLMPSIVEFTNVPCNQALTFDTTTKTFTETLTLENTMILSKLMMKYWLMKEVNDITQMRLHIQTDYKTYSENANIAAKTERLIQVTEELSQTLVDYGYRNFNFNEWASGNFTT
jgi:hypothetical protein